MNVSRGTPIPSEKAQREADVWFVRRRDGACMPDEEARFRQWLALDEAHACAYAQRQREWEALAAMRSSAMFRRIAGDALRAQPVRRRARGRLAAPVLVFACVAVAAVVAVATLRLTTTQQVASTTYITALGEQRAETLADGSRMILNTDSQVEVRMERARREVRLRHGEVLFDVARDSRRPFVVMAGDGRIAALGTRFQVREQADTIQVTLLEGRVEVVRDVKRGSDQDADPVGVMRWELAPGQQAVYGVGRPGINVHRVNAEALVRWTDGRIEIDALPLGEALIDINRYSAVKLRVDDPELESLVVSGAFQVGDNAGIAAALAAIYPLRVARSTETEIVLEPQ